MDISPRPMSCSARAKTRMYHETLRRLLMAPPRPAPKAERRSSASMCVPASADERPLESWKRWGRKTMVTIKGKPVRKAALGRMGGEKKG